MKLWRLSSVHTAQNTCRCRQSSADIRYSTMVLNVLFICGDNCTHTPPWKTFMLLHCVVDIKSEKKRMTIWSGRNGWTSERRSSLPVWPAFPKKHSGPWSLPPWSLWMMVGFNARLKPLFEPRINADLKWWRQQKSKNSHSSVFQLRWDFVTALWTASILLYIRNRNIMFLVLVPDVIACGDDGLIVFSEDAGV